MTYGLFLLLTQIVFASAMAWICFCRLVHTTEQTHREIRLAIWLQFVASTLVAMAPFLPGLVPELRGTDAMRWLPGVTPMWVYVLFIFSTTLAQIVAARFWHQAAIDTFRRRIFR